MHLVSDLHLSPATPKTLEQFEVWLAQLALPDAHIFLLGDITEVWLGDDHVTEVHSRLKTAIQAAVGAGARLYFMHGNRDFLLGEQFAEEAGMEILPDPEFLEIAGMPVLISHGDELCTDDKAYQRFRAESRTDTWKNNFLSHPLDKRIAIAKGIQDESAKQKQGKAAEIMDVNPAAVQSAFSGVWPDGSLIGRTPCIVHGHTHRCAVHRANDESLVPTQAQSNLTGTLSNGMRIVLPDWDFDSQQNRTHRGGYLTLQGNGQYSLKVFT